MKRFYKTVSTRKEAGAFAILLDGKPVRTPMKNMLAAPNAALAEAIMTEWAAQKEKIVPDDMPLTRILNTRLDRIPRERAAMTETLLSFLDTDLLCYRAERSPKLAQAQAAAWDQWLELFGAKSGTKLLTTTELAALKQPEMAHRAARELITALDDDHFTVLQLAAGFAGSLVLGLAFAEGAIAADDLFAAARVEENFKAALYNEDKYGPDPAQDKKDKADLKDLKAAEFYIRMAGTQ